MKLGIFGRAIVAASTLWMIGGTAFYASEQYAAASRLAQGHYNECLDSDLDANFCSDQRDIILTAHTDHLDGGLIGWAAVQAGVYLAIGLIVFLTLYGALKWVLAGAHSQTNKS
ncbi:hypothetical protein [Aurantiacibacter poecillastricola]|uniref:hypothetical protein n=1 Tax=Aurantiacibacter poecillastricola TaxID=3064385 RepID=UPI00273D4757|nr:hypothetical protein [Aurantiacibacter sp. 219JJ12-13]MDP5263206.1 hypothetical protein [Aurantiacibacter sp. 219JJ12-13]